MMPGQSIDDVEGYQCQQPVGINSSKGDYCDFGVADGAVDKVLVLYSNHLVVKTILTMEPGTFFLGNLALCYGKPIYVTGVGNPIYRTDDNEIAYSIFDVYWDNQVYAHVVSRQSSTQPSYFAPSSLTRCAAPEDCFNVPGWQS